ncbi:hypothetical protein [Sphingomonas sp.]|uniref:hypothetical protein n=1 Tax=Sphingomonas sp. TaxID=28214 RepID=UPI002EDA36B1
MNDLNYERLVETTADETKDTGMVDLVAATAALSMGYQVDRFTRDVLNTVAEMKD